ncbi:MAG: 16S rRNA (guanine(527)-N(7))-methyltransferase RsmG [Chloroflexota bacterium]
MEKFTQAVKDLIGTQLDADQVNAFKVYESELIDWNNQFNLTAIREPEAIRIKHFLDSLTCLFALDLQRFPESMVDIGTGAGFPGIPLKIIRPRLRLTLVESVHKKANFCEHVIAKLGLKDVTVISERAEAVGQMSQHRQKYDIAVARAVAKMPVLVEYLLPLVSLGGLAVIQKGEGAHREVQSAEKAIDILGGKLRRLIPILLPGVVEERFLVILEKVAVTSPEYPRKPGIPAKKPLI